MSAAISASTASRSNGSACSDICTRMAGAVSYHTLQYRAAQRACGSAAATLAHKHVARRTWNSAAAKQCRSNVQRPHQNLAAEPLLRGHEDHAHAVVPGRLPWPGSGASGVSAAAEHCSAPPLAATQGICVEAREPPETGQTHLANALRGVRS